MNSSESILGMALLKEIHFFEMRDVIKDLENRWGLVVSHYEEDTIAYAFIINGESIIIGLAGFEIPMNEIEFAYNLTYDLKVDNLDFFNHKSHLIISILANDTDILDRFLIFSKIIISLFESSNAFGFYYGDANKLFDKSQILETENILKKNKLPIDLWINFIVDTEKEYTSVFTNGLQKFNKLELEILNSYTDLDTIYGYMYDLIHYILINGEDLKNDETAEYLNNRRISIKTSEGVYVKGETNKLLID